MKKVVRGFVCRNCGFASNCFEDWVITEDDIKCKRCGSSNVEPTDIQLGVSLRRCGVNE